MEIKAITLTVEPQGLVKKIWYNNLRVYAEKQIGAPFINLLSQGSRIKGLEFLHDVRSRNSSMGVQLILKGEKNHYPLWVSGIMMNDEILVMAVEENNETASFLDYLQKINNEQVNKIRELEKEKNKQPREFPTPMEDQSLFDEVTRLNNEMATVHRQLTKKNIELEQVNQLKNRFLGVAAHDLRNPLNIIQSYADFIIDEASDQLEEEHVDFLNRIMKSSEYMLGLIENLLDYSMIESGQMNLNIETFDFVEFVKGMVEINNTLAERKAIHISVKSEVEKAAVSADHQKMEQVLNNLLSNAIKFSPKNTEIVVGLLREEGQLLLTVEDQGLGIKKEKLDSVFVPFTSLKRKGTEGEKGTGLGLSIVKRIVEAHDGKIWVDSAEGEGTTFSFLLPLK